VSIRDDVYVTRLLVHHGRVFGCYGFDVDDGSRWVLVADAVILAAGGHTRIWRRSSSRRDENTGDAMRLASDAGCRLRDMELVQCHPTGMVFPEQSAGTLVTEAVRGEGGTLRNALGERFMERYDLERLELSTRDRVALAVYTEIAEGRGTEHGGVLDGRRVGRLGDAPDRRRRPVRGRRVRDRCAPCEPSGRQLARRVRCIRPDRRRGGRTLLGSARRAGARPRSDRRGERRGRRVARTAR